MDAIKPAQVILNFIFGKKGSLKQQLDSKISLFKLKINFKISPTSKKMIWSEKKKT